MKKTIAIILYLIFAMCAAFIFGNFLGSSIADEKARKSAIDEEYLDMYEFCYEHDNNCDIIQMDYHYIKDGRATWVCANKDDESQIWLVHLELKKVAPFRYEWVEVEL